MEERCKVKAVLDKPTWIEQHRRVYDTDYLSPTLFADAGGDDKSIKIAEPTDNASKVDAGVVEPIVYDDYNQRVRADQSTIGTNTTNIGNNAERHGYKLIEPIAYDEQNGYLRNDGTVGTLTTDGSSPKHNNRVVENNYRIRKLTPKECFRLMGVHDDDFDKIAKNQSNSSLYHLAGDSIIVDVLMHIFGEMM